MAALKIAFEPPESNAGPLARPDRAARIIDFDHLARQTMGDKDLETEVLRLFARQARICMDGIARAPTKERRSIAHQLKGSARGVGAFAVAAAAETVENDPGEDAHLEALANAVAAAENLICGLSR